MTRFAALILGLLFGVSHAQTQVPTTISALNPAATLSGPEVLPADQGGPGATVKVSAAQIAAYVCSVAPNLCALPVATDSITGTGASGSPLALIGDTATPGDSKCYGTNSSGVRGWYACGTGTVATVTSSTLTLTNPSGPSVEVEIPATISANTTGNANSATTAANLSGTPTVPNGTAATTQTHGDSTTKLATDAFVAAALPTALPPNGSATGDLCGTYPAPSVCKLNGAAVPDSAALVGTNSSGQLVANTGTLANNISGNAATATSANTATTAGNLSGTPALPNGTTGTTQTPGDNTTKLATDAFVIANGSSATPPFSAVTSGTNPNALLVSGSLAPSGGGAITATSMPASGLTGALPGIDGSALLVLATNALNQRAQAAMAADRYNVKAYGAMEDALTVSGCSITGTSLTCTGAHFAATDCQSGGGCTGAVNKTVVIPGALVGNLSLTTTITGYTSATQVTIGTSVTESVPISYVSGVSAVSGTSGGTYAPGDTVTCTGGTFTTACVFTLVSTQAQSITTVSAGSGTTASSPCYITGTTGAGVLFVQKVSLSGGGINGIVGTPTNSGYYTTNPTSVAVEPVTAAPGANGCTGLTGATVALVMAPAQMSLTTPGVYSVIPTSPVSTGTSTPGGGTGATYTVDFITTGQATYFTDDTAAWNGAITALNNDYAGTSSVTLKATRRCIYMPAGVSGITGPLTAFATGVPACVIGDFGDYKSTLYLAPKNTSTAYDIFATDDSWEGQNGNFATYGTTQSVSGLSQGSSFIGINFLGDRTSQADVTVMHFYGQNDNIAIDKINAFNIKGQLIKTGDEGGSDTKAYTREGLYGTIRCFSCGDWVNGKAAVELYASGSATGGSDVEIIDYNAYGYYGDCLWIHSGATNIRVYNIYNMRCEGNQGNSPGISADGIHISGPSDIGQTQRIHIFNTQLNSGYYGNCGLHIDSSSSNTTQGSAPYDIEVNANFGGVGFGKGACVDSGSGDYLRLLNTSTLSTQPVLTVGATTFPYIQVEGGGAESGWSTSINSASTANVITAAKQQLSAAVGNVAYPTFAAGAFPYGTGANPSGVLAPNTSATTLILSETSSVPKWIPLTLSGTSSSLGGGALAAGACSTTTVSIAGVATSMVATAAPVTYPGAGNYWQAYVTGPGTVTVAVCAAVAGTPTASAYNVRVIP